MTDLDALKAELERQDRAFEACFAEMRALDPELVIAVSPETLSALEGVPDPPAAPANWSLRV